MQIENITETQLNILQTHMDGTNHIWFKADPLQDSPDRFAAFKRTNADLDHLVRLGMLLDVSEEEEMKVMLESLKKNNGREAYAMAITVNGMAMFGHISNSESKLPN